MEAESKNEKNQLVSVLLIILAGILWGSMGIFVRRLNAWGISSMEIVLLRSVVTCLCMLLIILVTDSGKLKIRLKDGWVFLGTGFFSIIMFNYCYFSAIVLTSLSVAAVLLYTAPVIVMLLSVLIFKEKISKRKLLALALTIAGCVCVTGVLSGGGGEVTPKGIVMGLGAGFGYALYSIFSRLALEKGYNSQTITFYTFLVASVFSIFLADKGKVIAVVGMGPFQLIFSIVFGIVVTVIPYLAYTKGLEGVEASRASITASVEPVAATIFGILIFGEGLSLMNLIGVLLVLSGVIICGGD